LDEIVRLVYRIYIGKGKSPQEAMNLAKKNAPIYQAAEVAKEAHDAGMSVDASLRKALGKTALARIKSKELTPGYLEKVRRGENPARRLNPNRLSPVAFTVKGVRHTGKAKLVGGKVKIFVTPGVARKMNPALQKFQVIYSLTRKAELTPSISSAHHRNYSAEVLATTARGASLAARKKKKEVVPGNPRNWHVLSIRRAA
jgi:hypothetical protein